VERPPTCVSSPLRTKRCCHHALTRCTLDAHETCPTECGGKALSEFAALQGSTCPSNPFPAPILIALVLDRPLLALQPSVGPLTLYKTV
jgi:hypothetical protein